MSYLRHPVKPTFRNEQDRNKLIFVNENPTEEDYHNLNKKRKV